MKPLIVIPSPRDIPKVKVVIDQLPADKLWLKYYTPEISAYKLIQQEFVKRKEYTHLIIIPDDLLVSPEHFDLLLKDIEQYPEDVICGYCNVDQTNFRHYANVSIDEASPIRANRLYKWFHLDLIHKEVEGIKAIDPEKYKDWPEYMIDVKFAGFPMMAIPRVILHQIPFRNDSTTGYDSDGCCVDVMFCSDVIKAGHRILVDTRLRENHLKISDYRYEHFMAGVLPPYYFYDHYLK